MAVRHTEAIAEDVERVLGAVLPAIDLVDARVVSGGVLRVLIDQRYALEVSSPGIPRPLTKPAHYERFRGREVDVRLHAPLEGRRRVRGELLESDGQRVVVRDSEGALEIPFAAISRAHLVEEL